MAVKKTTKASDHPLAHLIPDMGTFGGDNYISRTFANGVKDIDLLRYARLSQQNTLMFGPTGPGKTSLVLAYGAADNLPVVTIQCNGGIDPASFWGGMELDEESGTYRWVDSAITLAVKHGGIVLIDEVNFMPPKITSVFHGALDKRRQVTILEHGNEQIKVHPECQFIAAYNPDYEGTRALNPAFKNRFSIKVEMDYDPDIEAELLAIPVLQELAMKLRANKKTGDLETPVSTNALIEFENLAVDLGYEFALTNFLNAFAQEERAAVREAFDLYSTTLRDQLNEAIRLAEEGDDA